MNRKKGSYGLPSRLNEHPYFSLSAYMPIVLMKHQDLTDFGPSLAIDCRGTRRPEQSYLVRVTPSEIELIVNVADAGRFSHLAANTSHLREEKVKKPYIIHLDHSRESCYLTKGTSEAITLYTIIDRKKEKPVSATLFPSTISVEQRYLPPGSWHADEESALEDFILEHESPEKRQRIKHLTPDEERTFTWATNTGRIDDALYVMNKLPHILLGNFYADQSIPGIFTCWNRGSLSLSTTPIGSIPSAGITSGVRRFMHRLNQTQLASIIHDHKPIKHDVIKEIVQGMRLWKAAAA